MTTDKKTLCPLLAAPPRRHYCSHRVVRTKYTMCSASIERKPSPALRGTQYLLRSLVCPLSTPLNFLYTRYRRAKPPAGCSASSRQASRHLEP